MSTGRTLFKHSRFYCAGYDLSGYARNFGPLVNEYEEIDATCPLGDAVKGYLPGQATNGVGTLDAIMDPATSGPFDIFKATGGTSAVVLLPVGIRAAPAAGDPAYCGRFDQIGFRASEDAGLMMVHMPFGGWDAANLIAYTKPWGTLLHAKGAETAANTGTGIDDRGAATAAGGYFVYQIFAVAGTGSATLSVDDSADNVTFAALSGATSGAIAHTAIPTAGIVAIGMTATVRQYLRYQVALTTITSVTFASAFVRI